MWNGVASWAIWDLCLIHICNAGQNYGFMFIGYTLASFIGPVVSANALATTGSYSSAFPFLGALCIVGLVLLSLA